MANTNTASFDTLRRKLVMKLERQEKAVRETKQEIADVDEAIKLKLATAK